MLLAPHAGYAYSGHIAGRGFARVRAASAPSRAFVIGPSHVEAFDYTSVFAGEAYRTPLGDVTVDRDAARSLAGTARTIRLSGAGHDLPRHGRGEHGIEVELPFLQRAFPGVRVVPVVMGRQSWDACEELGLAIATLMAGVLLIVMGAVKMGQVIKYIPYPVTVGFTGRSARRAPWR